MALAQSSGALQTPYELLPTLRQLYERTEIDIAQLVRQRIRRVDPGTLLLGIDKEIKGLDRAIIKVLAALSVGRHVLLSGPIGSGKTTLAMCLAEELGDGTRESYVRVDSHPDITASDLIGDIDITAAKVLGLDHPLAVVHGPALLAHGKILIIDEINRMTPQAQASLLQVLQEGRTYLRGFPIVISTLVLATANPNELLGTFEMAEALRDRMMVVQIEIPDEKILESILEIKGRKVFGQQIPGDFVAITARLVAMMHRDERIHVGPSIRSGIYALSTAMAVADIEGKEPSLGTLEELLLDNFDSVVDGDFESPEERRAYIARCFDAARSDVHK